MLQALMANNQLMFSVCQNWFISVLCDHAFNGSLLELVYLELPYCLGVIGELESHFRTLFRLILTLMVPVESSRTCE